MMAGDPNPLLSPALAAAARAPLRGRQLVRDLVVQIHFVGGGLCGGRIVIVQHGRIIETCVGVLDGVIVQQLVLVRHGLGTCNVTHIEAGLFVVEVLAHVDLANCVLSLDGRPEVNDAHRPTAKGTGSYDLIVPKFQKLAESRNQDRYYVRGTFTHYNTDFSKDVLHLADLGFKQISVEPVVAPPEEDYAIRESDLPKLFEEYDSLAAEMVKRQKEGRDFNFFHFMIDLEGGPCVAKRLSGCGSGTEYLAVTPWGDLYPCHQFVGREEYRMGNVRSGDFDMDISGKFAELNIYTREDCRNCWARFYCSGGCSASNLLVNGDIKKPNAVACEMERKRLECAIALRAIAAGLCISQSMSFVLPGI